MPGLGRSCPSHAAARLASECERAAQQADAADEARLEASGSTMVGQNIPDGGKVVRASQLIRSVRRTSARMMRPFDGTLDS
jgi:hypothetical protein